MNATKIDVKSEDVSQFVSVIRDCCIAMSPKKPQLKVKKTNKYLKERKCHNEFNYAKENIARSSTPVAKANFCKAVSLQSERN